MRRVFGEPTARLPLTQFHVDEIARRVRAVQDDTGWGEVTLIIEDGRIHAMRSGSSRLLLDSLVAKPLRNPHDAES